MAPVGADAGRDLAVRFRTPDFIARLTVKTHDAAFARSVDRRIGDGRSKVLGNRIAHVRAPHDPGFHLFREVGIVMRLMRIRRREDAAAGKRKREGKSRRDGKQFLDGHL